MFTFNESKSQYNQSFIRLLGYEVGCGVIKPDSDRIKALKELAVPETKKALQHLLGLFAYDAKWILYSSSIVRPLIQVTSFPTCKESWKSFSELKELLSCTTL